VTNLGWRYIFIFLLPVLLLSLIIGLRAIEQKSELRRQSFDGLSFILIILTFGGLILGFSSMGSQPFVSLTVLGAFIIGVLGLLGLVWRSNTIEFPIIDLKVLKNHAFAGHVFSFFILQLVSLGLSFILPNYIQLVNHQTATAAGLIVLPGAVLGAIFAPLGGRILDELGAKRPLITGAIINLVAVVLFSVFAQNLSGTKILVIYLIFMAGVGLTFGNIMTNGLSQLAGRQHADGNAILTTLQQFAGATGTSIVAAIIAQSQTNTTLTTASATAQGSQHALIFLLVLLVLEFIALCKVVLFAKKK
jgi:MFS family permease